MHPLQDPFCHAISMKLISGEHGRCCNTPLFTCKSSCSAEGGFLVVQCCVWFLPAVSRLERHPISCKHTHAEGGRERERASATHTLRGNPISWKSRVTLQLKTHLTRSCPKSAGHAQLCFLNEKETRRSCFVFKPIKYKKNRGARAGEKRGSMEYFMVPAQKVPSLQHFRKTEKEVIGGLCRYVRASFNKCANICARFFNSAPTAAALLRA